MTRRKEERVTKNSQITDIVHLKNNKKRIPLTLDSTEVRGATAISLTHKM